MGKPTVRRQTKYVALTKAQFRERFFARFYDPAFDEVKPELERVFEKAWDGYIVYRKSPRKKPAGKGFADPSFALPIEWLDTRAKIKAAAKRQKDSGVTVSNPDRQRLDAQRTHLSRRNFQDRRLGAARARHRRGAARLRGRFSRPLDARRRTVEVIHPCKACVSTAQPLCHWPCSCYPNHALGQTNDWMAEIYPRWVGRPRRDHSVSGALVSGAGEPEADDRSAGLRRRRQSRSDDDARQGSAMAKEHRARRLGLSQASRRPRVRGRRAWRRRRPGDAAPPARPIGSPIWRWIRRVRAALIDTGSAGTKPLRHQPRRSR